eukprot:7314388-Alexandrium_andersonii.AAC.1
MSSESWRTGRPPYRRPFNLAPAHCGGQVLAESVVSSMGLADGGAYAVCANSPPGPPPIPAA